MDVKITDIAALRACTPSQISLYLRSKLWRPYVEAGGVIWSHEEEDTEVFVPSSLSMRGYSSFVADALGSISDFEGRSTLEIFREIVTASADVQFVHTEPDGEYGTTQITNGVRAYESLRQWILAAAVTEASDKDYVIQPTRKPSKATEFLRKVRLGPSFEGSFVITAHIPIAPQVGQQQFLFEEPQLAELDQPFERKVSLRLYEATSAALDATEEVMTSSGDIESFKSRCRKGVTANLCEALSGMSGEVGDVPFRLRFSWALSRPVEPRASIDVAPEEIRIMEQAARDLRAEEPEENVRVVGGVTRLHREGSLGPGEVSIAGTIDGDPSERMRRVWLELPEEDYSKATRAHDDGNLVSVRGNLTRRGNRYTLRSVAGFEVLPERT